ncbi:ABC transporter permease [Chiayiivirga flava]|uniref:Iron(III) transport system permease protein n=1 Tax=Chiayiivirga flava TaxID=659595 RepID=A0A7W8FZU3_9GAMM|nr:iron ABC transporter permease [Chiayiivirga flava]MBB5208822.1 iron(III) transport system permease protein [Chiayiivirga flava]
MSTTAGPTRLAAWLLALPMIAPLLLLAASWRDPQPAVWAHLRDVVLTDVLLNTAALAVLVVLLVSVLGVSLAWLSARCDYPGRRWLDWALVLPLAMPGYVAAFAYVGLFDYAGPVQSTWRALSGSRAALVDIRSLGGAAVVLSLVLYPYVYLVVRAAFLKQGAAAFDAARSLGHSPWRAFVRVALPLARPAWIAGVSLALLETLADFGAVSILGVDTFTTAIYKVWFGLYSLPGAAQLACVLLLLVSGVLLLERFTRGRGRVAERSLRAMPRLRLRGARAWGATTFAVLVFGFGFVLPVARLVQWAIAAGAWPDGLGEVATNTALIGATVAGVVLVIGLAFALLEHRRPHDRWLRAPVFIANLGYAVPGTVLAVASMLLLLRAEHALAASLGWTVALSSSVAAMVVALTLRFLRVGHDTVESGLHALRPDLLESARLLGAGPWRRLHRIVLPLLRPSLLAALLLVLVETMKEMPATLMLRPFGWDTLAVKIHGYTAEGLWEQAAWPALLLIGIGLLPVWLLVRRSGDL